MNMWKQPAAPLTRDEQADQAIVFVGIGVQVAGAILMAIGMIIMFAMFLAVTGFGQQIYQLFSGN